MSYLWRPGNRGADIVTDSTAQCLAIGDLRAAIAAGAVGRNHVHAELGDVLTGAKPGRERDEEIIVFDSTGVGVQDAASAAVVHRRALAAGRGALVRLGS